MKNILFASICLSALIFHSGCTREPLNNLSEDESRIYITKRDETVNFASYSTFSIADSVAVIEDNQLRGRALTTVDAAYINAVRAQMQARGYTEVSRDASPDLAINVSRIYNTYTGVFSYNDYLDYYGGYWDPYYWGYSGYNYMFPTYYGFYEITEGALSIDMFDLVNASNNNIRGVWNGLVRGAGVFRTDKAETAAQILFDQSTYLRTN